MVCVDWIHEAQEQPKWFDGLLLLISCKEGLIVFRFKADCLVWAWVSKVVKAIAELAINNIAIKPVEAVSSNFLIMDFG